MTIFSSQDFDATIRFILHFHSINSHCLPENTMFNILLLMSVVAVERYILKHFNIINQSNVSTFSNDFGMHQ